MRLAAASFALSISLAPASALAATLTSPSGLKVPLDVAGVRSCVVLPAGNEDEGCSDLPLEDIRERVGGDTKLAGFALVRGKDFVVRVALVEQDLVIRDPSQIDRYLNGMEEPGKDGLPVAMRDPATGRRYGELEVGGVSAFRTGYERTGGDAAQSIVIYGLEGAKLSTLMFTTTSVHAAELQPFAEAVLAKAIVPPPSRRFDLKSIIGGAIVGAGALAGLAWLVLKQRSLAAKTKPVS